MAKQTINIGAAPNDGTGTPLRTSFDYCNQNFTELYTATGPSGNNIVVPGSATISGDLTVASSILKVTGGNVGINTATPTNTAGYKTLEIVGTGVNTGGMIRMKSSDSSVSSYDFIDNNGRGIFAVSNHNLRFGCNDIEQYRIQPLGIFTWYDGAGGTRMTLNATGLGVGRSPAYKLDVSSATASNQLRLSGSNQNSITFANAAAGASNGFLVGRSFSSDDANNWFIYDLAASALRLFIGNTGNVGIGTAAPSEVLDVNSGNVKLGNGNVILSTSGKGIDFSATASGSGTMTSELLNDYEEGTWVPTITFATLSVGVTYSTQTGIYTKVGRIVHFSGRIDLSSKGTSVGVAAIAGLPFAANGAGAASVGYQVSIAPSGSQAMLTIDGTQLVIRYASTTTTVESTNSDFSNSSLIIFSGTYAV